MKALLLTLIIAALTGCQTVPVKHKERVSLFGGRCVENTESFLASYNKQIAGPDKWARNVIVWYDTTPDMGGAAPNPLAVGKAAPGRGHQVCIFQYDGKLWSYDDSTFGSPFPLSGVTLADKRSAEKLGRAARRLDTNITHCTFAN